MDNSLDQTHIRISNSFDWTLLDSVVFLFNLYSDSRLACILSKGLVNSRQPLQREYLTAP